MAEITTLIATPDASEVIRDKIAQILLTEEAGQRALAVSAGRDPELWRLRVFVESSNPWEEWVDLDTPEGLPSGVVTPLVNVLLSNVNFEARSSNVFQRQKGIATYNIDCFGYGVSAATDGGHDLGDQRAALEAQRCVRLVRNILMAAHYTYLGLPRGADQVVWKRWPQSIDYYQPSLDARPVQHVIAGRLQLSVEFNEFSPQVEGEALEVVSITLRREGTGEVFLVAQYGEETP